MKFSFIIPVYKVEAYLENCIDSILCQTYQDFEVILIDDGSPDKCPQLCDEFALRTSKIKVIHKKNGGLASARNEGLKIAKGDYVIFLDSDDWWCDNTALERISNKIDDSNPDVVIFASKKFYTIKNKYLEMSTKHASLSCRTSLTIDECISNSLFIASAWDKVIRKSILVINSIQFVEGLLSEDIEWCCQLLTLNLKYATIDGFIHVYRQQNLTSITANITNKNFDDDIYILNKFEKIAKSTNNIALFNFLALEFVLILAVTDKVQGKHGQEIIKEFEKFFYLLKYNAYPRVATVSKLRFLGYSLVRKMLIWYSNSKS